MKIIPYLALLSFLVGCASAPSPESKAASRVRPVIAALNAYHHGTGDYPRQLDELRQGYVRADVPFRDNGDVKHPWVLVYHRVDQQNYKLCLDLTPCSQAVYENGKFIAANGPVFR
jgi:hypothetical protein